MEEVHENKLVTNNNARPILRTSGDKSRNDERTADDISKSPDPSNVYNSDDPRRGVKMGCSDERELSVDPPNTSPHWQITNSDGNDDSRSVTSKEATVPSDSGMDLRNKATESMSSTSQKVILILGDETRDDLIYPASKTEIGHRQASKDTSRNGDSARKKSVKNSGKIPWWHELVN